MWRNALPDSVVLPFNKRLNFQFEKIYVPKIFLDHAHVYLTLSEKSIAIFDKYLETILWLKSEIFLSFWFQKCRAMFAKIKNFHAPNVY